MLDIPSSVPTTRTALMGMIALREALEQAGITSDQISDIDLISGTTVGGMDKFEKHYLDFFKNDNYNEFIRTYNCGSCTEMIAGHFGLFHRVTTLSTACSSAANAVIQGAELICSGQSECVVVGGSECITKFHLNGFASLMILDHEPCRPFDDSRAGLNLGEGAAWLVLESRDHALKRGASPLAYLAGYGNACDAFHQTATSPDGEGPFRAMRLALERAGIAPDKVDYINAHGTATGNNDQSESAAVRRLFGDNIPPISSTKAFTGHTTSASGTVEAVICLLAMEYGFIPVNLRFKSTATCVEPVHVQTQKTLQYILSNAFGFGGNDTALLFSSVYVPAVSFPQQGASHFPFLLSVTQISAQEPLCEDWKGNPISLAEPLTRSREADYKQFVSPIEARRMGKMLKRAIATARTAIKEASIEEPEAIVTGTGLGCIENTEIFLDALCRQGENQVMPTRFMQSTHNTVSSLVAINLHAHGYNATYSHGTLSFQSALFDAFYQLRTGSIANALVCAHDEMTLSYHTLFCKDGFLLGKNATECAVSMVLSNSCPAGTIPLCRLAGVEILYRPSGEAKQWALRRLIETAGVDKDNMDMVESLEDIFGVSYTASALDLYAAAHTMGNCPKVVRYDDGTHFALILLLPCTDC